MATPTDTGDSGSGGVLSPIDRLTELLYGIILVLTFTGTVRVAAQGGDDPATTLWAAVGCSLAWGLVDASMYVFSSWTTRSRSFYLLRRLRADPEEGQRLIADLRVAQHVSNAIALVLLFACGFTLARYTGDRPIRVALRLTGFGVVLIALTIALGG